MLTSKKITELDDNIFTRLDECKRIYTLNNIKKSRNKLIDLSLGSSDLSPPKGVLDAISLAIYEKASFKYCLQSGTSELREAAAEWCLKRFGVSVDPESEIQVLLGSQDGLAHLPLAVLNSKDKALVLDPCYPTHIGCLKLAGADLLRLNLTYENCWMPDLGLIPSSVWDQLRLFIFGYPHNPTGCVGNQSLLDEVMSKALKHDLIVVHDNPYVDLALDGNAPTILHSEGWREKGVEFFSLSKGWSLGGFRLAFAVGAEPIITALRKVKSIVDFNQSFALQAGAISALRDYSSWPLHICDIYRNRRDFVIENLSSHGWNAPTPAMALYVWLPIPEWALKKGFNSENFVTELLDKTGVALTPGSCFGQKGEGWVRMALVRPLKELQQALDRINSELKILKCY